MTIHRSLLAPIVRHARLFPHLTKGYPDPESESMTSFGALCTSFWLVGGRRSCPIAPRAPRISAPHKTAARDSPIALVASDASRWRHDKRFEAYPRQNSRIRQAINYERDSLGSVFKTRLVYNRHVRRERWLKLNTYRDCPPPPNPFAIKIGCCFYVFLESVLMTLEYRSIKNVCCQLEDWHSAIIIQLSISRRLNAHGRLKIKLERKKKRGN